MNFDKIIDRENTHSVKWDMMETLYGVSPQDGISMWVADMDFEAPQPVQDAVQAMRDHAIYGYFGDESKYKAAICWWMENRHGWSVDPSHIFSTHGLVHGTAACVATFTNPGDGVVLFTPVYHAFARVIAAADRDIVELALDNNNGRYEMDFDRYQEELPQNAKMIVLCSPHNPGGRVWDRAELEALAEFAKRNDLIIVSDEIHHDLTFGKTHVPMAHIDGIADRLIMMTASTKTFNIAGAHIGNVIIADPALRARFAKHMAAMGQSPNSFGLHMVTAVYSPAGAEWLDTLVPYLDENRRLFDAAINDIPGLASMPLESTYLAWVDFSGTGMPMADFTKRVLTEAKIAVNAGPTFGKGGEDFLRFNFATPRARVIEATERMKAAFADLQ